MKKFLVAAAVCMSAGTVTFAQTNDSIPEQKTDTVPTQKTDTVAVQSQGLSFLMAAQGDYKEVTAEALTEKVQAAVKTYAEAYIVKKLEYNEGEGLTRVTLEDKGTKAEKVIILDGEGQEKK